jgi:Skp family chaperone for outer membrane proteins
LAIASLVGRSQGQAPSDTQVRRASNQGAPTPAPPPVARIGTIDIQKVVNDYKKYRFAGEQLKTAALQKQAELIRIQNEQKQVVKELEGLDQAGNDFKARETRFTELKAELEAKKEQAQAEMARREAEALATIYNEIHAMAERVARHKGYNYIVQVSNEPVTPTDPNLVIAALRRTVFYADTTNDITEMVVLNLNDTYDKLTAASGAAAAPPAAKAATGTNPARGATGSQTKGR